MRALGLTDVGLHRKENQDGFAVAQENGQLIAVVCDGMGGERGGAIASSLAINTYLQQLRALLRADMTLQQKRELSSFCVAQANTAVHQRALEDFDCRGMGTTLVSILSDGEQAVISNIGDSRAYLIRAGKITRITHDHSVVEHMVETGDITPEEARTHPNRNLITRALGPDDNAICDNYELTLQQGDRLLLCSDGLIVTATDEQILQVICEAADMNEALESLIALARRYGAPDNVTAVLMENL